MVCPECKKVKLGHFDLLSIKLRKKCCDCHEIWAARPENDPETDAYKVTYQIVENGDIIVHARSEEEAREEAEERLMGDGDIEIENITKLPPPDWKELVRQQDSKSMGEPAL